jgi:cytochrome c oxidase cbb3-type subunit I/II
MTMADNLSKEGIEVLPESEMVALIAYLQRLGTDIKK